MGFTRGSKYRSKRTEVAGIGFHSKREALRYQDLVLLQRSGEISGLEIQPEFQITIGNVKICKYIADFRYKKGPFVIVEDVKGFKTPVYQLKKKLMKAVYGIDILET